MKRMISLEAVLFSIVLVAVSAVALADWTQGIAAFNNGDYRLAAEHFTEIIHSNPEWPGGYYMLGRCQTEIGDGSEAITTLEKALELDPSDSDTVVALGRALMKEGKYPETRRLLEEANTASMSPALRSQTAILLASAWLADGKAEAAVDLLQERIAEVNSNPALFRTLGRAQEEIGNQEGAFRSYSEAFELDHDEASGDAAVRTAISIAEATTNTGQKDVWFRHALAIGTQLATRFPSEEHSMAAGHAALGAEDFKIAEKHFRAVLAEDQSKAAAWYSLGRSLCELERENQAYDAFSKALISAPDEAMTQRIHGRMGQIAACRLDLNTASAHYRSAEKPERAEEIEILATEFASALNQLERLRETVKEIQRMERELEELGDDQGVTAMRERAASEQKKVEEIEENLEAVRTALCR